MSDTHSVKVAEPVAPLTQPVPNTTPVPLDSVISSIASDAVKNAKEYLKETVTPGGGE